MSSITIYPIRYYVYAYVREDGTPYYIGKGKDRRAYQSHARKDKVQIKPPPHHRIIIIEQNLTDVGACAIERRLIRWYGKKHDNTGILVNILDGGNGGGVKGLKLSEETKEKIRQANLGKKQSPETLEKKRLKALGSKRSKEALQNMSKAQSNRIATTKDAKHNMSEAAKNRTKHGNQDKKNAIVTCPHCNKSGGAGIMQRWHFQKCKSFK